MNELVYVALTKQDLERIYKVDYERRLDVEGRTYLIDQGTIDSVMLSAYEEDEYLLKPIQ